MKNLAKSNDSQHAPLLLGARFAEDQQWGTVGARTKPMKIIGNPCVSRRRNLMGSASTGVVRERALEILRLAENLENPCKINVSHLPPLPRASRLPRGTQRSTWGSRQEIYEKRCETLCFQSLCPERTTLRTPWPNKKSSPNLLHTGPVI